MVKRLAIRALPIVAALILMVDAVVAHPAVALALVGVNR